MNRVTVLQGVTEEHFHRTPGEVERASIAPERNEILRYLATIDRSVFPNL